ncbi:hypothetical protein HDU79_000510 [Rhizoclosmatium sp. JEL0117]|nr:hypothetical protein HDU79_000510 [Rhizoclosmatium sp. JEL0117]
MGSRRPLPSIGGSPSVTPYSPLKKSNTVNASQTRETVVENVDLGVNLGFTGGALNLTQIPATESRASTLPRKIPTLSQTTGVPGSPESELVVGSLRRMSGTGNGLLRVGSVKEYTTSHEPSTMTTSSPNATLKRMNGTRSLQVPDSDSSGSLKRANGSGDVLGEVGKSEDTSSRLSTSTMPRMSSKSADPPDSGMLKRISGSGDIRRSESDTARARKNSNTPSVQVQESEGGGGLKRVSGSKNMLGDFINKERNTAVLIADEYVATSPIMPHVHYSDDSDGVLKRFSVSGRQSTDLQETSSKSRQLGQIDVNLRPVSDEALQNSHDTITSPIAPKMRQFGQVSLSGLKQQFPQDSSKTSSTSSLRRTPSPSGGILYNSSNDFNIKTIPKSTSSESAQFTWNFGDTSTSNNNNNSMLKKPTASMQRRTSDSIGIFGGSPAASPSHKLLYSFGKPNAPTDSNTRKSTTSVLQPPPPPRASQKLLESPYTPALSSFPDEWSRTPTPSTPNSSDTRNPKPPSTPDRHNSARLRKKSVKRPQSPSREEEKSNTQDLSGGDEYIHLQTGYLSSQHLLHLGDSESESEPALLSKRKQAEETIAKRALGTDGETTTLSKMHALISPFLGRVQMARHRWWYSIFCVLKVVRGSVGDGGEFRTRESKSQTIYSTKIRALMMERRSSNVVKAIQKLLFLRSNFLFHLTSDQQWQLCSSMHYYVFQKGAVATREGQERRSVYFILSGECEVISKQKGIRNHLSTGDMFGNATKGKWTATVSCKEVTEVLVVQRNDYAEIINLGNDDQIQTHIHHLSLLAHFSRHLPTLPLLKPLATVSQIFSFNPQEPIIHEGVENFSVFWILSGTVRAVKLVPFLKQPVPTQEEGKKKKYALAEYEPGVTIIKTGEKVVMQLLTIRELGVGDHFPDMIGWESDSESEERGSRDYLKGIGSRSNLLARLSDTSPSRPDSRAYISIIANTNVEILGMTRLDYVRLATPDMIAETVVEAKKLRIPLNILQQSILN